MRKISLAVVTLFSIGVASGSAEAKTAKHSKNDDSKYYDMKDSVVAGKDNDPWEAFNKPVFDFNLGFDRHIAKPVIHVYDYTPLPVRHSISNFLSNLTEPLNVIHGVLQLNPKVAFTSFWRFILNSTFGILGIHDFARESANLHNIDESLGKTMAHWGLDSGPYVVLPIIGPSNARNTLGKVGDWFLDPVGWVVTTPEDVGLTVADGVDTRDTSSDIVEHLYYESLDPYVTVRSAYLQHEDFESSSKK